MAAGVLGPVEILAFAVPELTSSEVFSRIASLTEGDAVRLLDVILVTKNEDGGVDFVEVEELPDGIVVSEVDLPAAGLTGHDDVGVIAEGLAAGSSAIVLLVEHVWAADLVGAVHDAGGGVVASEWVPAPVVNQLIDDLN